MKILFIAETLTYGGAARRFVDLANALAEKNHSVSMFIYSNHIQIQDQINKDIEIKTSEIEGIQSNWIKRNIIYRSRCIKIIDDAVINSNCDIIISFNDMVNINVLLSKEARKRKIIISERSDPYYNKFYLKTIKRILFNRADGIVFQTEGARDFFQKLIINKSKVIPNPVPSNIEFPEHIGARKRVIVSVARLWIYQKRQDLLIKAFNEFSKNHEDYTLVLYGDGPDEVKIRRMIKELHLSDKVQIAGAHPNVIELIKGASMFVLSSDFEGIPNSLIEAMSIGLPVISTDCSPGGAKFLIENNYNGLLVEKSNYLELANAMMFMVKNPIEASNMGHNARKIINRLDRNKIYFEWEQFILNKQYGDQK
ncbi:glycosyltransferase [Fusibacter paucivorans]|uniref:Glycosyltransferase n=1 Tax=Fusibacter paucivorans TaxID=76009 RepID=A0ABS5PSF3_9FIRM|nr:glycosyltransferase [Fusibacter paucivorans]MBS7528100.1 glycosyltransferase [Fusibacter paucivorans]